MMNNPFIFIFAFSLICTVFSLYIFIKQIKVDPRSLRLGRWGIFSAFFLFVTINLGLLYASGHGLPEGVLVVEAIALMGIFMLVSIVIFIGIIVESIRIWRRENHSIANLLLPLTFLALWIIGKIIDKISTLPPKYEWLKIITDVYPIFIMYISWQFIVFFASSIIYGWLMTRAKNNYFVVLGAGLINGDGIGKLLGSRIEKAVSRSNKQDQKATIVFSGGQGPDEKISEAYAMRKYAVEELSYDQNMTILEDESKTTYENLVFSSKIINKASNTEDKSFLFFTSEYHVFRAALFAKSLGLDAQGIGSKTAMYYRIPAFIREFIAVLNADRKKHLIFFTIIFTLQILLVILTWNRMG